MKEIRRAPIKITGGEIFAVLMSDGENYSVLIDGIEWVSTASRMHAIVLFTMLAEHVTEYVHYELRDPEAQND